MKLVVYYTSYETFQNQKFEKRFTVRVTDYCLPSVLTVNSGFLPDTLIYTIFEPALHSEFEPTWTTVPAICNLRYEYRVLPAPLLNPNLIKIEQPFLPASEKVMITVEEHTVYHNGDWERG